MTCYKKIPLYVMLGEAKNLGSHLCRLMVTEILSEAKNDMSKTRSDMPERVFV